EWGRGEGWRTGSGRFRGPYRRFPLRLFGAAPQRPSAREVQIVPPDVPFSLVGRRRRRASSRREHLTLADERPVLPGVVLRRGRAPRRPQGFSAAGIQRRKTLQ